MVKNKRSCIGRKCYIDKSFAQKRQVSDDPYNKQQTKYN